MRGFVLIRMLVAVLMIAVIADSCSKKSTKPEPASASRVYVSIDDFRAGDFTVGVYIFDGDADTIIDSIGLSMYSGSPLISADPSRARIVLFDQPSGGGSWLRVYEGVEMAEPTMELELGIHRLAFTRSPSYLLASQGGLRCTTPESLLVLNTETLSAVYGEAYGLSGELHTDSDRGLVYGLRYTCLRPGHGFTASNLGAYDYVNMRPHREWIIRGELGGDPYFLGPFDIHPDGRRLYAAASGSRGLVLICYDLEEEELRFEVPLAPGGGEPRVSPDGSEVWHPESGNSQFGYPETIRILSAETGTALAAISLSDYRVEERYPVQPRSMRFLPSGEKVYVSCSSNEPGPLLVVDARTREVIKSFFVGERFFPRGIAVGPAPR